jgi:hypothetical protein
MPALRTAFHLAEKMGTRLGERQILLGSLPRRGQIRSEKRSVGVHLAGAEMRQNAAAYSPCARIQARPA